MDFHFEKGGDLTVWLNGAVLGGVFQLNRTVKNSAEHIYEFLTDKPVASMPAVTYVLTFRLHCSGGCPFDGEINEITVADKHRRERYTLCTVRELHSEARPRGYTEYTVTVEAAERSVADE